VKETLRKNPTQSEIARRAKVSQAAVSAILSGSRSLNVSAETRANVLAIAKELGYVVRRVPAARNGASAQARPPSVVIVEADYGDDPSGGQWLSQAYNELNGRIYTALGNGLQAQGGNFSIHRMRDSQSFMQWLNSAEIDGVIWRMGSEDEALLHWVASRYHLVLLNREWSAPVHFDSVVIDQEKGVMLALEHLWKAGHRRIAYFGHTPGSYLAQSRLSAYHRFTAKRELYPFPEFQAIPDRQEQPLLDKVMAMVELIRSLGKKAPTAILTGDIFSLVLVQKAQQAGIRIPEDLSVVGIDNLTPCAFSSPPLTSLEMPFEVVSRMAIDLYLQRREDRELPSRKLAISPRLIVRESVTAPATAG